MGRATNDIDFQFYNQFFIYYNWSMENCRRSTCDRFLYTEGFSLFRIWYYALERISKSGSVHSDIGNDISRSSTPVLAPRDLIDRSTLAVTTISCLLPITRREIFAMLLMFENRSFCYILFEAVLRVK